MQQSAKYLLIGNGRLARHFRQYFKLLNIPFLHWSRSDSHSVDNLLPATEKAILCISDTAIQDFIVEHKSVNPGVQWIHTSGALTIPAAAAAHPLATFADDLYSLEFYQSIWFITDAGQPSFKQLFPELPNPHRSIPESDKSFYHAWTALAGNCTSFLWDNYRKRLQVRLGLPRAAMEPYLQAIMHNILSSDNPMTGPLTRNDSTIVELHRRSLAGDPFAEFYEVFIKTYSNTKEQGPDL